MNYRFYDDVMGSARFNGIRVDANCSYPIEDLTFDHIRYHSVGGVRGEEIPSSYPAVVDRLAEQEAESSENYYPDWSRAAFMDIRNVRGLVLNQIVFSAEEKDEREPYYVEHCEVARQDIQCKK